MPQLNLLGQEGAWSNYENANDWSYWRLVRNSALQHACGSLYRIADRRGRYERQEEEAAACPDLAVPVCFRRGSSANQQGRVR